MARTKITAVAGVVYQGPAVIATVPDPTYGYMESVELAEQMDKEEVKNGSNTTVCLIFSDRKLTVKSKFTHKVSADRPKVRSIVGTQITVAISDTEEIDFIADSASLSVGRGAASQSIDGTYYPGVVMSGGAS